MQVPSLNEGVWLVEAALHSPGDLLTGIPNTEDEDFPILPKEICSRLAGGIAIPTQNHPCADADLRHTLCPQSFL